MAKNFYAVKRGYDKKQDIEVRDLIFTDWYEVAPLVKGYDNARYKGFDTEEEAETWLSVVDKSDAEKRTKVTIDKMKEEITGNTDIHNLAEEYDEVLEKLIKEYRKFGWNNLATIGNLTTVLVNKVNEIYGGK